MTKAEKEGAGKAGNPGVTRAVREAGESGVTKVGKEAAEPGAGKAGKTAAGAAVMRSVTIAALIPPKSVT